jgi:hypothetical protein
MFSFFSPPKGRCKTKLQYYIVITPDIKLTNAETHKPEIRFQILEKSLFG